MQCKAGGNPRCCKTQELFWKGQESRPRSGDEGREEGGALTLCGLPVWFEGDPLTSPEPIFLSGNLGW